MEIRKELEKMSPEDKIKKLKHLEEKEKKKIHEIEELIKESMRELRTNKIAKEVAPEARTVDISHLFEAEQTQEGRQAAKEDAAGGYERIQQMYNDYTRLVRISNAVNLGYNLTQEQKAAVGQIRERISTADRYMSDTEKAASRLDASMAVLHKLRKDAGLEF